jgi:hypothetical protein
LAELGWSIGTVFAALTFAELGDDATRRQRLRELALERYLTDVDDGWVLRRARNYRGRVQIEGEEATGRELLLGLLADREWLANNFLLARESVRVIPHPGQADDIARDVRREAIELADSDSRFEPLRAEIHGAPSASTARRVRAWADGRSEESMALAIKLASDLDAMYGVAGREQRVVRHREALARRAATAELAERLDFGGHGADKRFPLLTSLLHDVRATILEPGTSAATRLQLFDLVSDLEGELALTVGEVLSSPLTRRSLFAYADQLLDAAYGAGFLTAGEYATLGDQWKPVGGDAITLADFEERVASLRRIPQWAAGSVRHAFAEPLVRYTALDPRAARFVDDVLRGSPLVGLADVTQRLARDLARLTGAVQFGAYIDGELKNVGQCSGMSDGGVFWRGGEPNRSGSWIEPISQHQTEGTRAWFTVHQQELIGTVIEVRCNAVTKAGALRHPQFVRTRPDKDAALCGRPTEQRTSHE